jgi:hypothetical protein
MRFVFQLIAIMLTAFVFELFLPWYSIAVAGFIFGYGLRSNANFLAGFLGVALLWLGYIILIEASASADLADRVAKIFPVKEKNYLIAITILLGGLVAGFATLTGSLLHPSRKRSAYRNRYS